MEKKKMQELNMDEMEQVSGGVHEHAFEIWVIVNVSIVEAKSSVVVVWEDDMSSSARVVKNVLLSYNFLSLQ